MKITFEFDFDNNEDRELHVTMMNTQKVLAVLDDLDRIYFRPVRKNAEIPSELASKHPRAEQAIIDALLMIDDYLKANINS